MAVHQSHYEDLLALYSSHKNAVALLRQYRPYLEKVPSIRRSQDSIVTIPLPLVQVRQRIAAAARNSDSPYELQALSCDIALLMCDPEWQIKTGVEIFVYIYRPGEDFSDLLSRWRQTQVLLSRGYSWDMPLRYQHIFNEGAEKRYPLFILFSDTPKRILKGMRGAGLPFVLHPLAEMDEAQAEETVAVAANDAPQPENTESQYPQTDLDSES